MRRRFSSALFVALTLAVGYVVWPSAAGAATFTTTSTCPGLSKVCDSSTTPAPPGGASVDITGAASNTQQIFTVEPKNGAQITGVAATFSDGGTVTQSGPGPYIFTISAAHFVSHLDVTWNDLGVTTTTAAPSTTTSTSSTSSTTTTSTTTTTTTTVPVTRGPGNGPNSIRPDGIDQSSPDSASVRGVERTDVVIRGSDGHVYWSFENIPDPWTGYTDLGQPPSGSVVGDPTIASWGPGRLDVFARGSDDRLWQTYSEDGGATWIPWLKPFGDDNVLRSGPEASTRGPGRLNVYHVGTDGSIYERFYEAADGWNGGWLNQGAPPGGISGDANGRDATATSWGDSERIDLFARGADDNLWQKTWDGTRWSDWTQPPSPGGRLRSAPDAASWEPGNLLVFARFDDNGVYALPYGSGGWGTWVRLVRSTDSWQSGPGASSRGSNRFDVFARGTDNLTYHIWQ